MKLGFFTLLILCVATSAYSEALGQRNSILEMNQTFGGLAPEPDGDVESGGSLEALNSTISSPRELSLSILPPSVFLPPSVKCGVFTHSKFVRSMFARSSQNWGKCQTYLSSISASTGAISRNLGYISNTLTTTQAVAFRLKSTANNAYKAAVAGLSVLKGLPKVGLAVKVFLKILDNTRKLIEMVYSRLASVKRFVAKVSSAFKVIALTFKGLAVSSGAAKNGYAEAATVTRDATECASNSSSCRDDTALETHNWRIRRTVFQHVISSQTCPTTLAAIANVLRTMAESVKESVFKAIASAVESVRRTLQPIIDAITNIIKEVSKHLTIDYCCATPFGLQQGFKVLSQLTDLATCPVDGAQKGLEAAKLVLARDLNNMINLVLSKLLSPVRNIAILVPAINPGSAQRSSCSVTYPTVTSKSIKPFQPWINALQYEKPSIAFFSEAASSFGNEVVNACKDAVNEVGRGLKHDCCKDYKPLADGQSCDPLNVRSYKKCSQCSSGTHSWWFDRVGIACGKAPCGKDGKACGLATTCKHCCNGHSWWYSKAFTLCGKEPCWKDGARCGWGTSCKACCNKASYWPGKLFSACGREPCWEDGARCGEGTTCRQCCNGSSWWYTKVFTACGKEPCWKKGKRCAAGTSCNRCCRGKRWITSWSKLGHFCK